MDDFKSPAFILAASNSVVTVGIAVYFYRQITELQVKLLEVSGNLNAAIEKINEIQKPLQVIPQYGDAINNLHKAVTVLKKTLDSMDFEQMEETVDAIVDSLDKQNIKVEKQKKKKKKNQRRVRKRDSDDEDDEIEEKDILKSISAVRDHRGRN